MLATNKDVSKPVATMTFDGLPMGSKFKVVKPDGNCGCVLLKISCGSAKLEINTTTQNYPFKGNEIVVLAP